MNILVIPTWYPNGTDKLMGIYHKEFCEALSKRENIKVNMLYVDRQRLNAPLKYLTMTKNEVIEENGYKVYIKKMLDISRINFDLQLKRYCKVLEKAYLDYIKTNKKPDVLHAQVSIPAGYAACKLGEKYNIPVVVTEHTSYFNKLFEGNKKEYGEYVLKNAYLTTVSKFMAKEMSKITKKCAIIPNLVDTKSFNLERKKVKSLKLITVSALRQGKKIDDIIKALKIIIEKEKIKDATLTIIGDGFLEDYYKNKCHELNMDKYVNFIGRKNKEEIAKLLVEHNIFVIASDKETFCIPGVEALASGMPIISTKCLGPEEYLNEKCGKLVEVGDTEEMAKAILDVYQNLNDYNVKDLRKIASKYDEKTVTDIAIKIYKELKK